MCEVGVRIHIICIDQIRLINIFPLKLIFEILYSERMEKDASYKWKLEAEVAHGFRQNK